MRRCGKRYNKRGTSKAGRGCIPHRVDIAERHPKFTILTKITANTAGNVYQATVKHMQALSYPMIKSSPPKQRIASTLNTQCYFAAPYHSWERVSSQAEQQLRNHDLEIDSCINSRCYFSHGY